MTEEFIIGLVGAPFGVEGFVKVKTFSGEAEHFKELKELRLRQNGKERLYSVDELRFPNEAVQYLFLKLAGIDSPEAAKTLNGAEIIVPRANASPLKDGEFYVEDLKGLDLAAAALIQGAANGENLEVLGRITGIVEGGGGDLAEIKLVSGEVRLVPFREEFFGDINIKAGRAVLLERWILE